MQIGGKLMDPIGRLMGLRYKSHPWHGIDLGSEAPKKVNAFIEMVPTDTVKYEVDKSSGYLRIDRPQKYSNVIPALYGFLPQTYCGKLVGDFCMEKSGRQNIIGDGDPLDICILTEKAISHGDILVKAIPIGGFRMIDGNEADDKIIAVLKDDATYGHINDMADLPTLVIDRLKHYFLTYKDIPGEESNTEIPNIYGQEEALEVIQAAMTDYMDWLDNIQVALSKV
jgi:inorganic pyrophosphatase